MSKTKKCKWCKERVEPNTGAQFPSGFFCSFDHAIKFAKGKAEKKRSETVKACNKAFKDHVLTNDRPYQLRLTQKAFNHMRRLEELKWFSDRGQEPTCISCGGELGGDQWANGHLRSVGAQGALRFDKRNSYLQHNRRCNMALSGDIEGTKSTRGYKQGLLDRFGDKEGQAIIDYCESQNDIVKWDCEQLVEMRKEFNANIRDLMSNALQSNSL